MGFKEKIFNALGTFGIIIYYGWSILVSILPFVMIDFNFWLTALFIGIELFFPPATLVFCYFIKFNLLRQINIVCYSVRV